MNKLLYLLVLLSLNISAQTIKNYIVRPEQRSPEMLQTRRS